MPPSTCAGDRYLLKLFRDFVFHQMDEEGRPILDWGHVIEALNKLDAAVPEQVCACSECNCEDLRKDMLGLSRDMLASAVRCVAVCALMLSRTKAYPVS